MIKLTRIDDRLVHGQVVFTWVPSLGVDCLLIANDKVAALTDINGREKLVLVTLAVAVLALGLMPNPLFDVMHASVDALLDHVSQGKL